MSGTQKLLLFEEDDAEARRREASDRRKVFLESESHGYDVARTWCNPKDYCEIVGVDFGGGKMHCHRLFARDDITGVPLSEVRKTLSSFDRNSLVIVESAHLAVPQTDNSLAQPFTASELTGIYGDLESRCITLLMFPQSHTRKAREWSAANDRDSLVAKGKSSDINDARALAYYVANNNGTALAKPPSSFGRHPAREYGILVRSRSNSILNAARVRGYEGEVYPSVAKMASGILSGLGPRASFVDYKVAYSIASLVVCEIGGCPHRYSYKGNTAGWSFWRSDVLLFSSLHYGGGIARSNLLRHRFRPFLATYAKQSGVKTKSGMKYVPHGEFSHEQEYVRRDAWAEVRREVRDAYRISVDLSAGFAPYEILREENCGDAALRLLSCWESASEEDRKRFLSTVLGSAMEGGLCQSNP